MFVAGHPGSTDRLLTVAQLKSQRDVFLPFWLLRMSELRGRLIQFSKTSPEAARRAKDILDSIENSIKVRRMEQVALNDDALDRVEGSGRAQAARGGGEGPGPAGVRRNGVGRHREGRARQPRDPRAVRLSRRRARPSTASCSSTRANSSAPPTSARSPTPCACASTPTLAWRNSKQALEAESPVYPDLEQVRLSFSLERMREWLGPDHPVVKAVLGASTPDERARELVDRLAARRPQDQGARCWTGARRPWPRATTR